MLNFFIRKHATLPILKLKVVEDTRKNFHDLIKNLDNANITFSMQEYDTGIYKVANKEAGVTEVEHIQSVTPKEFYIYYQFEKHETSKEGKFLGQFKIDFLDYQKNHERMGELIVPIENELFIHVLPSFSYSDPAPEQPEENQDSNN